MKTLINFARFLRKVFVLLTLRYEVYTICTGVHIIYPRYSYKITISMILCFTHSKRCFIHIFTNESVCDFAYYANFTRKQLGKLFENVNHYIVSLLLYQSFVCKLFKDVFSFQVKNINQYHSDIRNVFVWLCKMFK